MTNAKLRATIAEVLAGTRAPHELRDEQATLWRDGFRAGCNAMQERVDAANHDADRFYYLLHNPAEVRAQHQQMLKAFDVALNRQTTAEQWAELDRIAAERAEAARD